MSSKFVIDANVLIKAYVRETDSSRVITLLQSLARPEPDVLYAPEFCLLECANILWKQVRFQEMPVQTAQKAIEALNSLPLSLLPVISALPRALTIGINHQLAIYDSIYIVLAETLECPLITVDERQAKAARAINVTIKSITDYAEFVE